MQLFAPFSSYGSAPTDRVWDLEPDDERLLVASTVTGNSSDGLGGGSGGRPILVDNFFEALEQIVPE